MSDKVIVLEIKDNYAIAIKEGGEIVRINKKPNLSVGDKVYILPEDLYKEEKVNGVAPMPFVSNKSKRVKINQNVLRRAASIVAVFILCFSFLMLPQFTKTAYAMASFDGENSVQMELDKNNRILTVESLNNTVSKDELKKYKGKNIKELDSEFNSLLGNGTILIGYAPEKDNWNEEEFVNNINALFGSDNVVYLLGSIDDIDASDDNDITIGRYIAGKMYLNDELEDILEELEYKELVQMLKDDPTWMEVPEFKDEIEDRAEDLFDDDEDEDDETDLNDLDDDDDSDNDDNDDDDDDEDDDLDEDDFD